MDKKAAFNPLVSIVIPVYNGSNYVREALDSALAQTYKNIEIIVVNDGSTDNTDEIVKSYGKKLRYFKKKNGGVATALNFGIRKSKGEFISWLSHDDVYYPEKLQQQIEKLSLLDRIYQFETILYSNYSLIDECSNLVLDLKFEESNFLDKLNYPLYPIMNGLVNGCTLLIPRKCFFEVEMFDTNLRATQDYALWFKMFPKYKLLFQSNRFVKTRIHSKQGTKVISSTADECNELWIKMIEGISDQQKIKISGGILLFYQKVYNILKNAGYVYAEMFVLKKINKFKTVDTTKVKVSVIIPFFNRISWTIEAVKSVINQTHRNLEIIVIDDSSTDDVSELIKLCYVDKRIKYIKNSRNCGVSTSRNLGIKSATGDFIAFLDSDDLFLSNKIETQLSFMISNNYSFSHTSYEVFGLTNESTGRVSSGIINYSYPTIVSGCSIATPTVMVRRDLFVEKYNRFPEQYGLGEDVCLWITLSRQCELYGLDLCLSKVRQHGDNASLSSEIQIIGIRNQINFVFDNCLDNRSYPELKKLSDLLFWHVNNIYIKKEITNATENYCKDGFKININRHLLDLMLITFYKLDKLVPKKIRSVIKGKLLKYEFVNKYLIR